VAQLRSALEEERAAGTARQLQCEALQSRGEQQHRVMSGLTAELEQCRAQLHTEGRVSKQVDSAAQLTGRWRESVVELTGEVKGLLESLAMS
jgi:flagellar biosynthesis/type III secretory pathway chaperone